MTTRRRLPWEPLSFLPGADDDDDDDDEFDDEDDGREVRRS